MSAFLYKQNLEGHRGVPLSIEVIRGPSVGKFVGIWQNVGHLVRIDTEPAHDSVPDVLPRARWDNSTAANVHGCVLSET